MEKGETLRKFTFHLEKAAWGPTLSPTHIKHAFLDKISGIQDIEVVFEDRVDD